MYFFIKKYILSAVYGISLTSCYNFYKSQVGMSVYVCALLLQIDFSSNSLIITICEEKYYTIPITRRSINRLDT